jgi:ABC-2 type transport system ATP-binding protein
MRVDQHGDPVEDAMQAELELVLEVVVVLEGTGLDRPVQRREPLRVGESGQRRPVLERRLPGEVIFLDEPTTGLDPRSRQALWDVVAAQAADGVTIFLTTQDLDEADRLADRIAVIDRGRIVAQGTAAELKQRVAGERLDLQLVDDAAFEAALRSLGSRAAHVDRPALTIGVPTEGARQARAVLDEIDPTGGRIERFTVHTASLDDAFLALTGKATTPEKESTHV